MIVLSTAEVVKELLDKRGGIYSDRMESYVGQTLGSGGLRMLFMRYADARWRMILRIFHSTLNVNAAKGYVPYQVLESKQMLHDLQRQPELFLDHIRRYAFSLTTSMTYGWRTPTFEDPQIKQLYDGFDEFAAINRTGSASLLDFFPLLRWLPAFIISTKKNATDLHRQEKRLYLDLWFKAKHNVRNGTANSCLCIDLAAVQEREQLEDDLASYISGTMLEAGSDTTSNTLYGFVQAMVLFPVVQKKAQEEIDRVVGRGRLPNMEDESELQYVRGCVKETLRWMPTAILGFPHAVTRDDEYLGYKIPAGSGVMQNVYTINMDPSRYPDPRKFEPNRFKDDFSTAADSAASLDFEKRDHHSFGAGRRICKGMHVAERSLFLGISGMLWAFDFKPAVDGEGREVLPDPEKYTQGFACLPEPFRARITPREKERAEFVTRQWEEARDTSLDENMQ